jgi:amidohydrolase
MDSARLRALIKTQLPDLVAIRHDLHRHPELSYTEHRTSKVVQRELAALGIEHKAGLAGGTGVLAYIPPTDGIAKDNPAVALRADMDALPIAEQTGKPYASKTPGIMHACGHDGHTTILLGVARALLKLDQRPNPVLLIFQPAEEGGAGGERMCQDGVLDGRVLGPRVARIFGLHGWPNLPVGLVATRPGPLLAATDNFDVIIRGVQAHAAYPHFGKDPILAMAQCIGAIQSIASRSIGPLDSVVVSVGEVHAGTATNIIPEIARFTGTVRTLVPETRKVARERFFTLVESTAAAYGCGAQIDWEVGYPVTNNDPGATEMFFRVARDAIGSERVLLAPHPSMGGEDFSYYGQHVPACFFVLGLVPPGQTQYPTLHQPDFDFNDEAIPTGIELFCRLATAG